MILDLLKEFMINYYEIAVDYLPYIKETVTRIYLQELSVIVKERTLSLIAKVIEVFDIEVIEKVFNPKMYLEFLLNEIKLKRLQGSVKGEIWHVIGLLISKFSFMLNLYKTEVNDVIFSELTGYLVNHSKFEFRPIVGILKSMNYLLEDHRLSEDQITNLYIYLKGMINPLEDANSTKINKLSLTVLSNHGKVFYSQLQKDSIFLFDLIFQLCNHKNNELKHAAHEAIEKISRHISQCLNEDKSIHKDSFGYIMLKIKSVLEDKTSGVMINTAISLSKHIIKANSRYFL